MNESTKLATRFQVERMTAAQAAAAIGRLVNELGDDARISVGTSSDIGPWIEVSRPQKLLTAPNTPRLAPDAIAAIRERHGALPARGGSADIGLLLAALDEARAEVERLREVHRDLTRRLGFGDNITEPQADNDTIVAWYEQQGREADEWRESQRWRDDCALAGHPDDEECPEHDPDLLLDAATARADALAGKVERVEALAGDLVRRNQWWTVQVADELRAALAGPAGDPS